MTEKKHYTWEQKIDNLVRIAKEAGTYLEVEIEDPGSDGHKETRRKLRDAYDAFCDWRHDEPYVVDEIKELLVGARLRYTSYLGTDWLVREYVDELTGVHLTVERDNPGYPGHPKLTLVCPNKPLSLDETNAAIARLLHIAGLAGSMPPLKLS